jgi:hypothetical protein
VVVEVIVVVVDLVVLAVVVVLKVVVDDVTGGEHTVPVIWLRIHVFPSDTLE